MAWQLIYTSAQRTLTPGQYGYGTVARSPDLREALVQRLEQLSYYDLPAATTRTGPCPVVHACRILDLRGSKYHLLSRIVDARLDFTNRTNHLAHHLILTPGELAGLPSPATLLRHWDGWKDLWSEEPRFLDESDWGNLPQLPASVPLPAVTWAHLTGDAGRAAALVDAPAPAGIQLLVRPDQQLVLLDLFGESLQLLDPDHKSPGRRWEFTFTTLLQNRDNPADFHWRGGHAASDPRSASSPRSTGGSFIPPAELPVPETPRATLARRGPATPTGRPSSPGPTSTSASASAPPHRVSPSDTPTASLRLNRSQAPDDSAGPEARPELHGHPGRARRPVPPTGRGFTRRLLIPLVALAALALVLFAGFYQPGWFVDRRPPPRPPSTPTKAVQPEIAPAILAPTPEAATPSAAPAKNPNPPPTPETAAEATALLEAAFDRVPTYLLHSRTDHPHDRGALELGPIPELEALLRRVFGKSQDLADKDIRVLAQTGDIRSAVAPSTPERQPEISQLGEKKLSVGPPGASSPLASLNCTEWIQDPQRPILLSGFRAADRGLALVFQPAPGSPEFDRFRLLLITGQPSRPIELRKSVLRAGHTNLTDSLDPEFLGRLPRLPVPPAAPYRYQLRTFTGSPPTDLFEPYSVDYPVAEGSELALGFHQQKVRALIDGLTSTQGGVLAEIERLKNKVETQNAKDLPLGNLLRVQRTSKAAHLASLNAFVRHQGGQDYPDQNDFLEYLRALFTQLKIPARDLLGPPRKPGVKDIAKLHALLASELKATPELLDPISPSYFTNRWDQFGTVDLIRQLRDQALNASNRIARLNGLLERIPPDLDATPRVSLHVVDSKGARLFEFIRFTDPPRPTPP